MVGTLSTKRADSEPWRVRHFRRWLRILVIPVLTTCTCVAVITAYSSLWKAQILSLVDLSNGESLTDGRIDWINYHGNHIFTNLNIHKCLKPRVALHNPFVKNPSQTFAISYAITEIDSKVVAMVLDRIKEINSIMDVKIVILLKDPIKGRRKNLQELQISLKAYRNVEINEVALPFQTSSLTKRFVEYQRNNPNCCGVDEFMKLNAWDQSFSYILMLDLDVQIHKPVHHLLECKALFLYSPGPSSPLNGGMFLLNTKVKTKDLVKEIILSSPTYSNSACWQGLGCGPCQRVMGRPVLCYGSESLQGFLHYFFVELKKISPVIKVNMCLYGSQVIDTKMWKICQKQMPYIVHKANDQLRSLIKSSGSGLALQPSHKQCRPDFWIVGVRKGGTTALYTHLTLHEHVASWNVRGSPQDGEVTVNRDPLPRVATYNSHFKEFNSSHLLVGDASVHRLVNGIEDVVQACGHKYSKFIVLLRDPVERCHSQMLMRARLGTNGMSYKSNMSEIIEREINAFKEATNKSQGWIEENYPPKLFHSAENCVYEGIYISHLKRMFFHASLDNILVIFTEDLHENSAKILQEVANFLNIKGEPLKALKFKRTNSRPNGMIPSNLLLTDNLRAALVEIFAPYNIMLNDLLGYLPKTWTLE